MGTLIVGILVVAIVAAIIAFMIKERRAGRHPTCGGDCASCGGACHCGGNCSHTSTSVETSYQSEEKPIKIGK